jgi:hypothetical protein
VSVLILEKEPITVEDWQKYHEALNQFVKTWPCLDCKFRTTKSPDNNQRMIEDYFCLESNSKNPYVINCANKVLHPEIRYYLGKYKVRLLPKTCPTYKPHSRVFEALEEFPCDAVQMMMEPGSQYMTSTRYLYLKPIVPKETAVDEIKRYRAEYAEQGNEESLEAKS